MSSRGIDILVMVESKTTPGTYVAVGGQRNATFTEESGTIDTTTKTNDGYAGNDYGLGSWNVSCDGIYVIGNAQLDELKNAQRNKEKVKLHWTEVGSTTVEEGMAVIASREIEAPYDDSATYTIEFTGDGKPKEVTPAP